VTHGACAFISRLARAVERESRVGTSSQMVAVVCISCALVDEEFYTHKTNMLIITDNN